MSTIVRYVKKDRWVQGPQKKKPWDAVLEVYSGYSNKIPPATQKNIHIGVIIEEQKDQIVLVCGQTHDSVNRYLNVKGSFLGKGELQVTVANYAESDLDIDPFSVVAKAVVLKVAGGAPKICDELDATERGHRGFGSTGKN